MTAAPNPAARVLLVSMPFGNVRYPSMALSVLKPRVRAAGHHCDVAYLNLLFEDSGEGFSPFGTYERLTELCWSHAIGDWVFAAELAGRDPGGRGVDELCRELDAEGRFGQGPDRAEVANGVRRGLMDLRALVDPFIDRCLAEYDWGDYDVIGFTCAMGQRVAALALARRVSLRHPGVTIALGGSNCDGVMGRALLRAYPFVDWVFSGEADESFPEALTRLNKGADLHGVAGLYLRDHADDSACDTHGPIAQDFIAPDHAEYFEALDRWAPARRSEARVTVEFSRGCWWADRAACTFCSANERSPRYRLKDADTALAELVELVRRHGCSRVMVSDNAVEAGLLREVMPGIAEQLELDELWLETRASLRPADFDLIRQAGAVEVLIGVESLDTATLELMSKGTTLLHNLQAIKWSQEAGLLCNYNILYGFPGEDPASYTRMADLIPLLSHLRPPRRVQRVGIARFSSLFDAAVSQGLVDFDAFGEYAFSYDVSRDDLVDLMPWFLPPLEFIQAAEKIVAPVQEAVEEWRCHARKGAGRPVLMFEHEGDEVTVYDTRPAATGRRHVLKGLDARVFIECLSRRSAEGIARSVGGTHLDAVHDSLGRLAAALLLTGDRGHYLALPLDAARLRRQPSSLWARMLAGQV